MRTGVDWLLVGHVAVDDEGVSTCRQDVGPDNGDVVPLTVVELRRRVDDDGPRSVARVEHVARLTADQLDRQKITVHHSRPAVDKQAVRLQRSDLHDHAPAQKK